MDNHAMEPGADDDDDVFVFPPEVLQAINEENQRSLIVKLLNPKIQKSREISVALPKAWRFTGSVRSMTLVYNSEVKFIFESESDLLWVLDQGPWTFKDWMLVIDRFTERENPDFLRFVSFWVDMFGIPWDYRHSEVIKEIGSLLGQVLEIDNQGPVVRARIRIDVVSKDLDFVRRVIFGRYAEPVEVRFVYEKLKMFCQACGSLTHHKALCPRPRTNRV
ncbi:hypothetical protein EUTSA_v10014628mg [Eutrema salsugineum]|uniref:DUF4283 domain-containing protein n=1 Tax=Eutrema salsugineum TaxID=72664 RepID=V4KWH0_EUTSA|nr:uncharacterized protein At4g02000 [Eutrema salsugineum]ESQ42350.1 hypothetical protein EUTSA_v10014628mg [Eutrema salsugineum]